MSKSPREMVKKAVNTALSSFGLKLVRDRSDGNDDSQYIPFEATIAAARAASLSVGDYIDQRYNVSGATQSTIDQMAALGVFSAPLNTVVEIGPGSGRYLEKIVRQYSPSRYEIYETAPKWGQYLVDTYGVIWRPTDGRSLKHTETASADLVHAQKVFSTISFVSTIRYWPEMIRVAGPHASIVFDIMTAGCLDDEIIEAWDKSEVHGGGSHPAVMPREIAVGYFKRRGFALAGSFMVPMKPGKTETLVFKRTI